MASVFRTHLLQVCLVSVGVLSVLLNAFLIVRLLSSGETSGSGGPFSAQGVSRHARFQWESDYSPTESPKVQGIPDASLEFPRADSEHMHGVYGRLADGSPAYVPKERPPPVRRPWPCKFWASCICSPDEG